MSLFVTFEGPEGSGKTTQIKLLAEALTLAGHDVLAVREPGGTPIGDQVREVVHALRNRDMDPRAECLLYGAARAQLVEQRLKPHLAQGGIVLCDRYADSPLAYQGYGCGPDLGGGNQVNAFKTSRMTPAGHFHVATERRAGPARRRDSGDDWNRMDDQALDFHRRVCEGYRAMIAAEPERWFVVNGAQSVEAIQQELRTEVKRRLTAKRGRGD